MTAFVREYPSKVLDVQEELPNLYALKKNHRTAIFVDGPNISYSGKICGQRLNFNALRLLFEQHSDLRHANYYSPVYRNESTPSEKTYFGLPENTMQKFFDYLSHSRWTVVTPEGFYTSTGKYRTNDIDSLLGAEMQLAASTGKIDTILVVSNDGDFVPHMQICRLHYGIRFLNLSWSVQNEEAFSRPSHMLRNECEISLDIAMPNLQEYLILNMDNDTDEDA